MKDFDILQKFGRGVSIDSETFLTIVSMASQISCPPDWAGKTVENDTKRDLGSGCTDDRFRLFGFDRLYTHLQLFSEFSVE